MYLKNEKGSSLTLVLIVMVVLTVLGSTLLFFNSSEARQTIREEKKTQAYYIARSGVETVLDYILNNPDKIENLNTKININETELGNGKFKVKISKSAEKVIIKSIGIVDNVENEVSLILRDTPRGYIPTLWQ